MNRLVEGKATAKNTSNTKEFIDLIRSSLVFVGDVP
jgi:hypothetical protein